MHKIGFTHFVKQTSFIWKFLHSTSLIWKAGIAAAIAWEVAKWTGSLYPFFAPLAAILCVQVTVEDSVMKGYQRVAGIIIGVIIAYFFVKYAGVHSWSIGLMIIMGLGIATLLKMPASAVSQAGVSALLVLTVGTGADDFSYGIHRILETIIGAAIAVIINMLILPPDFTEQAITSVSKAAKELCVRFEEVSKWLANDDMAENGNALLLSTRSLLQVVREVQTDINLARKAIKYSPLLKKRCTRLALLKEQMQSLEEAYVDTTQMFEIIMDWRQSRTLTAKEKAEWSSRFAQLASVIDMWRRKMLDSSLNFSPPKEEFQDTYLTLEDKKFSFSLHHEAHQLLEHLNATSKKMMQQVK